MDRLVAALAEQMQYLPNGRRVPVDRKLEADQRRLSGRAASLALGLPSSRCLVTECLVATHAEPMQYLRAQRVPVYRKLEADQRRRSGRAVSLVLGLASSRCLARER